jgi:hypothetical protein
MAQEVYMRTVCLVTSATVALLFCAASGFANPSSPSICDAATGNPVTQNLIVNCGFEQDNFNGWTVSNPDTSPPGLNDGNTVVGNNSPFWIGPNSGLYFAALGNGDPDLTTLSQTFNDIVGTTLTFSFYYASDGNPHTFEADWDGTTVFAVASATATTPQAYTQYSFSETATGSDTISFLEQNPLGFDALDDVVVADPPSVPEPSLLGFGVAALCGIVLVRRYRLRRPA